MNRRRLRPQGRSTLRRLGLAPLLVAAMSLFTIALAGRYARALSQFLERGEPRAVQVHNPSTPAEPFVYAAEDGDSTLLWWADVERPATRRLLQRVIHAPGWAGAAAVDPAGRSLVYTRLPPYEQDPVHGAELWWLNIAERRSMLLAAAVDLRSSLVWSPDGSSITFRRIEFGRTSVWRQRITDGPAERLAEAPGGIVLLPIDYADAGYDNGDHDGSPGRLLAARFDTHGSDFVSLDGDGEVRVIRHLSDGTVRNLVLSPDRWRLAFLALDSTAAPGDYRGGVVDLRTAGMTYLPEEWGELVGVAWEPDGTLVAGSAGSSAGLRSETGEEIMRSQAAGFRQPLVWSHSGRYLAARLFSGPAASAAGTASDVVLGPDGFKTTVAAPSKSRFIGWLDHRAA